MPRKEMAVTMPHHIRPMLATLTSEAFDRAGWIFEIKWDGYRAVAEIEQGKVRLYSRNHLSYAKKFPALVTELQRFGHDAVLDGEVVAVDADGKPRFQLLQQYQKTQRGTLIYYVFDVLYLDGVDLRSLPLLRRKERLAKLFSGNGMIRVSDHIDEKGVAFLEAARAQGLEGIIAKNAASPYLEGARSAHWLKIKIRQQQEAVIAGYTEPRGTRRHFGALLLGVYDAGKLTYIGHTGSGFDAQGLDDMQRRLKPLARSTCPFAERPKTNAPPHWVEPRLVCEVAFQEWTEDGTLRFPIFLGLREDKPARDVKREIANPSSAVLASNATRKPVATSPLPLGRYSNLDKVYWPKEGYTKGDLLAYYHEVASFLLPHLHDRPLSLNRHPNGIDGKNFFQKDMTKQAPPPWVQTALIESESVGPIRYLLCQDERTLLYVANLGCIELNPWNSRLATLDNPDFLVIDLDPQDVPFAQVVEAAQETRKLLEACGAECFCKTSGKRGLHIYLPLGARYSYDHVRQSAELLARRLHARLPDTTSLIRSPAQRRGRIYIDYLQNRRGQTMAAPYSLRPVAGATVSTPLRWQEVRKNLDPAAFTIHTLPRRLDKIGDLWTPLLTSSADLEKLLRRLHE